MVLSRSSGWRDGLVTALAHGRLDVADFESGFVVAHGGASRRVIYRNAFDTGHLTNALFHFVHTKYRQHVMNFNSARFHCISLLASSIVKCICFELAVMAGSHPET